MKAKYFVFIHRPGKNWRQDQPLEQQPLSAHFQYMTALQRTGKLVLGGGFTDGAGALGVIKVSSLQEAQRLVADDPAVKDGLVVSEVHPWFVTVAGNIEHSRD